MPRWDPDPKSKQAQSPIPKEAPFVDRIINQNRRQGLGLTRPWKRAFVLAPGPCEKERLPPCGPKFSRATAALGLSPRLLVQRGGLRPPSGEEGLLGLAPPAEHRSYAFGMGELLKDSCVRVRQDL